MGLIRSDLVVFGSYIDFCVTKSWLQHLYRRMNFTRRMVTTSRPVVTKSIYDEVKTKYLHDIVSVCLEYQIPDELIINIDQTPSKYVSTDRVTMAQKGTKHVSRKGSNDKRAITVTYAETLAGDLLPFELIYKGKTVKAELAKGFLFGMNDSHWSNETETLKLLDKVVSPYLKKKKVELKLPESQKSCIIWDAFGAHRTDSVISKLEASGIEAVGVPKNLTHLLQPLTTNSATTRRNDNSAKISPNASQILYSEIQRLMSRPLKWIFAYLHSNRSMRRLPQRYMNILSLKMVKRSFWLAGQFLALPVL